MYCLTTLCLRCHSSTLLTTSSTFYLLSEVILCPLAQHCPEISWDSWNMFFYKKHFYSFQLKPSLLGSKLKEKVKHETVDQLEGQCLGKLGYVIKVKLHGWC